MKITRAYYLSEDVVKFLDSCPDGRKNSTGPMKGIGIYGLSRSQIVDKAVRYYWLLELGEEIENLQKANRLLQKELIRVTGQRGLFAHLKRLLRKRE